MNNPPNNYYKVAVRAWPNEFLRVAAVMAAWVANEKRLPLRILENIRAAKRALVSEGHISGESRAVARVLSWTFPFRTNDADAEQAARAQAQGVVTKLYQLRLEPQLSVFSIVRGVDVREVGAES